MDTNLTSHNNAYAIIVAAGRGSRFGGDMPKQFQQLAGRPMLMTTIDRFRAVLPEANIILVVDATMERFWLDLCAQHGFASPRIVYGGDTRWASVRNAVATLAEAVGTVMIHDGARPLVTEALIERLAEVPTGADGIIPAVAVTDSLRMTDGDGSQAVDRSRYVAVQTPQSFRIDVLRQAYRLPYQPTMTDDASVAEAAGFTALRLAQGEPTNIKVTNPTDMALAETLLKLRQK